jgi:bacteriophage N4 adsorption protein B
VDGVWTFLFHAREELLLFSGFWFLVGGIDDLAVDLAWLVRTAWRRLTRYRVAAPLRADQLPAPGRSGPLAVFVPAWQEAAVIGQMLIRCQEAWRDSPIEHHIYVGCYKNDPASIAAVIRAASGHNKVRLVLCDQPGPTTKADCLNRLWRAMTEDELAGGYKVKALILHDAEDSVHRLELRVFDYLIERAAAVQLPVIPVQVPGSAWISGHYGDEFAEAHGKTLVVREALGAAVPLAGVGCAIERNRIGRIAIARNGQPFDADSLTEDYELGLALGADGGKTIFARLYDAQDELVGTRACFPDSFSSATRQKSRWMIGIALAGWDRLGWQGGLAETWMRLRDRKAVFAALVLFAAYICIFLTAALMLADRAGLFASPPSSRLGAIILLATLVLLGWRMLVRVGFVWLMHGAKQAMLSIPRSLIANLIAIVAARRACQHYLRYVFGAALAWDKTAHAHFPEGAPRHG